MGFLVTLLVACDPAGIFPCDRDTQCVRGGETGICQPAGFCSFPDDGCASGHRYADASSAELAGQCVAVAESSTGDPVASSGTSTTGSEGTSAPTSASTTTPDNTTGLTQGVDVTSSGDTTIGDTFDDGSTGSTGGSEDESGEGTTASDPTDDPTGDPTDDPTDDPTGDPTDDPTGDPTTSGVTCPEFFDGFGNGNIESGPWDWFPADPPLMSESGGELRYQVNQGAAAFGFIELDNADLSEGYTIVKLSALPNDPGAQFLLRVFGSGGPLLELTLTDDMNLTALSNNSFVGAGSVSAGASDVWLGMFFEGGSVSFGSSTNGVNFQMFATEPVPANFSNARISLMGGSFANTSASTHTIEVDEFEYCSAEF